MNNYKLLFISLFLLAFVGGGQSCLLAQRNKTATPIVSIEESMAKYDFPNAVKSLETQITQLKRKRQPTTELEAMIEKCNLLQRKLESTEQVVFIDSMVVPKADIISSLPISPENGSIQSCSTYFNTPSDSCCTVFKSELGNKIIYSSFNGGKLHLMESDLIGTSWSEGTPLAGLNDDEAQNYPYMLSDGTTLYFAAQGEGSCGGYDIFMTRYDADSHKFLTPENIGMPFNSPANDYLYVIDDFHNLGWFVTDRNQPEGYACIYCFIPNNTRQIYNAEEIGTESLRSLAMINCIRDSWKDEARAKEGVSCLLSLREELNKKNAVKHDFDFVLNDKFNYTTLSQFRNPAARNQAQEWLKNTQKLQKVQTQLSTLRDKYASTAKAKRQSLSDEILSLEEKESTLRTTIHQQEKQIRMLELN